MLSQCHHGPKAALQQLLCSAASALRVQQLWLAQICCRMLLCCSSSGACICLRGGARPYSTYHAALEAMGCRSNIVLEAQVSMGLQAAQAGHIPTCCAVCCSVPGRSGLQRSGTPAGQHGDGWARMTPLQRWASLSSDRAEHCCGDPSGRPAAAGTGHDSSGICVLPLPCTVRLSLVLARVRQHA